MKSKYQSAIFVAPWPTPAHATPPKPATDPRADLEALYAKQQEWVAAMQRTDDAIDLLEAQGYTVRGNRRMWCWNDSPYAAEISAIEKAMGV